mmetsp:Transcript_3398/g.4566  ORF Transcript_3398/g.4566 Transcript_3398/m.4566 type:complete len:681 (+) Transcript_3398:73-2115(+)
MSDGESVDNGVAENDQGEDNDQASSVWGSERPRKPDEELVNYIASVGGSLASAISERERKVLVANVFSEISKNEASLAGNKKCSVVIEQLLKEISKLSVKKRERILRVFICNCRPYFGWLCYNRFSSHVIQTLFGSVFSVFNNEDADSNTVNNSVENDEEEHESDSEDENNEDDEDLPSLQDMVTDLTERLVNTEEWWNLMFDQCGTHTLRSLICLLSQQNPSLVLKKPPKGKSRRYKSLIAPKGNFQQVNGSTNKNEEFNKLLVLMLSTASRWEATDTQEACKNNFASPVLQLLLDVTATAKSKPKKNKSKNNSRAWETLVNKILSGGTEMKDQFKELSCHPICSHVIQIIVTKCSNTFFNEHIFNDCLKGNLSELSSHHVANYVIQHALSDLREQDQISIAFDELEGGISSSLLNNHLGVVWKLAESCANELVSDSLQKRVCKAILNGIRASRSNMGRMSSIQALIGLSNIPKSISDDPESKEGDLSEKQKNVKLSVNVLGVFVSASLLRFRPGTNRAVLESIASIEAAELATLCKDPVAGKHLIETIMDLPKGHAWVRQRILNKLVPDFVISISENRFGWHVIRKGFDNGTTNEKVRIVKSLAKSSSRLAGNTFGARLLNHCKVQLYKQHPDHWNRDQNQNKHRQSKKKENMKNWLDDLEAVNKSAPKKKKRKKNSS